MTELGGAPNSGIICNRIIALDACRSMAIALAMLSHVFSKFELLTFIDQNAAAAIGFALQLATPTFIILFGSMIEIVYRPRIARGYGYDVTNRLLMRALQCYLLYVLSVCALLTSGQVTIDYALRCALMMGVTPYTDILKFYAVALTLAPALIVVRSKLGLPVLFILIFAVHAAHPLIASVPDAPAVFGHNYLLPLTGFLYSGRGGVGGPSLLHGISLVAWGMATGRGVSLLLSVCPSERRQGVALIAFMVVASAGAALALWDWQTPFQTVRDLADMSLRHANNPLYFAVGATAALLCLAACLRAFEAMNANRISGLLVFGRTSLFTFSFGNILLYLAPHVELAEMTSLAMSLLFILLITLQSVAFAKLQKVGSTSGIALAFQTFHGVASQAASDIVAAAARRYSFVLGWPRCGPT